MFLYIHILNAVIVNNVSVLSAPCSAYKFSLNVLKVYSLKGSAVFSFSFFFFLLVSIDKPSICFSNVIEEKLDVEAVEG